MSKVANAIAKEPNWFIRKHRPDAFANGTRLLLAVIAAAGLATGVFAILKQPAAEAGGTAILIGSLVLLLLALVGKLPDRFSSGSWEIEFRPDSVREILALIQSESPDLADKVEALVKNGTRPTGVAADVLKSVSADRAAEKSFEDSSRSAIRLLPGLVNVEEDIDVKVPGKGRPPKVDVLGNFSGKKVAFEIKGTWTNSVQDLLERRVQRLLRADAVDLTVIVVHSEHVKEAVRVFADEDRVVVIEPDEISTVPSLIDNS